VRRQLRVLGEAAGLLLREDQIAVDRDFEDASRTRDELQLAYVVLMLGEDLRRQTDGLVRVASLSAVRDLYPHLSPFPL
jgi:hypothetical protein